MDRVPLEATRQKIAAIRNIVTARRELELLLATKLDDAERLLDDLQEVSTLLIVDGALNPSAVFQAGVAEIDANLDEIAVLVTAAPRI